LKLIYFFHSQAGELETVATVHSYEEGMPAVPHKTNLTSLNVNKRQDQAILLSMLTYDFSLENLLFGYVRFHQWVCFILTFWSLKYFPSHHVNGQS